MMISCRICGHVIRSEKPDAEAHVLKQMSNHLIVHPKQAASLAEDLLALSQLLAVYLLVARHVNIPPDEIGLLENFQKNEAELLNVFGVQAQPQD